MTKTAIKNKVLGLEAELELIKRTLVKEPDLSVDEKNWKRVKPAVKKARKNLYRSRYGKK